jgi:hypothetical protein
MRIFIVKELHGYEAWDIAFFTNREAAEECKKYLDSMYNDDDYFIHELEVKETFNTNEK